MLRKLTVVAFALLVALPAFPDTRPPSIEQASPALHLMNDTEFALFLTHLDAATLQWEAQLRSMDVKSLGLARQDTGELEEGYSRCLQSLGDAREEIQKLSQKQTLRTDLLLLVDLNDLARNLDGLDRDLATATTADGSAAPRKSFSYVRAVLGIDAAVGTHTVEFRNHVFAFAKVIDATLDQAEEQPADPPAQQ